MKKESLNAAIKSFEIEKTEVTRVLEIIRKKEFSDVVDILVKSNNIITSGSGGTGIAAKKFAHSLSCIECNGIFLSPSEAIHGGFGVIKKGDAVVIVSKGGKTTELIPFIDICKKKEVKLICISQNKDSILAKNADVFLEINVENESDFYNIMATSRVVVLLVLFDALQVAIMKEKGFTLEEFALIHPGGAVGKQLNT